MPRFINTLGKRTLAVATCQRCQLKMAHADMVQDPDTRLWVHPHCVDESDPWRLPPRAPDRFFLPNARPDSDINHLPTSGVVGPQPLPQFLPKPSEEDPGPGPGPGPDPNPDPQPSPGDFGPDFSTDYS